ncbi:hypothetical protein COOONC_13896 [Cooperia oncophora]
MTVMSKTSPNVDVCAQKSHGLPFEFCSDLSLSVCFSTDCPYDRINGTVGPGCADSNGAKCHRQCVAGCTVPDDDTACYGCLHYNHRPWGCMRREMSSESVRVPKPSMHHGSGMRFVIDQRDIDVDLFCRMSALRGGKDVYKPANGVCATICPEGLEEGKVEEGYVDYQLSKWVAL